MLTLDPDKDPQVAHPRHVQFGQRMTDVETPYGIDDYDEMLEELIEMTRVLKGHADAPVQSPYLGLMEVATAYLARAYEMEMLLHVEEHRGFINRGDALYRFRTGPLRSFIDMARKMTDLGSRRLSQEALLTEQRRGLGERW